MCSVAFVVFAFVSLSMLVERLFVRYRLSPKFDMGEWLINYKGGFVRRGLFGEFLLHVLNLDEPYAGYLLFLFQALFYLTLITFLFNFMRKRLYSWSSVALCCSPAVGLFFFENDSRPRKELVGLFALIIFVIVNKKDHQKSIYINWLAILIFGVSCFSSEINALLLPSFLYVLHISNRGGEFSARFRAQKLSLIAISIISFGLSAIFHGNNQIAKILCSDVIFHGFPTTICGYNTIESYGAIDWLGVSISEVFPLLRQHFPLYFGYFPLILLAIIPIILTPWFRSYWRWCLVCTVFVLPLYVSALDYGRWTFMLATELVIMIIATKDVKIEHSFWNKFTTPIFTLGWGIPSYAHPKDSLKSFFFDQNFLHQLFLLLTTSPQWIFDLIRGFITTYFG
jgi:hypothetical protein